MNSLTAHVRTGPSRTQSDYDALTSSLQGAWDSIIKPHYHSQQLGRILIVGSILAGRESGFTMPPAGQDEGWLRENWAEFERRAEKGDEDFVGLIEEVKWRGLLK